MNKKRIITLMNFTLAGVICALIFTLFRPVQIPDALGDPDYYYHIAISKITSEKGLILELPQVDDLGWGSYFPDKEFFFHLITGTAYKIGEEGAVASLPLLLSVAITLSLIYLASQFSTFPIAAATIIITVFATTNFFFRLNLLRPHLLAILFFIWVLIGCTKKNKWMLLVSTFLFGLSYHALYLPLIPVAGFAFFGTSDLKSRIKFCLWPVAGLFLGITLNPYFPSNIVMGFRHMMIALGEASETDGFGLELVPLGADYYITTYFIHWVIGILALVFISKERSPEKLALCSLVPFFLFLTALSPRAAEYAVPVTAISASILVTALWRRKFALGTLVVATLISFGFTNYGRYQRLSKIPPEVLPQRWAERMLKAVEAIPKEDGTKKVFNFEWPVTPYIFYKRPDLAFVDILDPSFLVQNNRPLHELREKLARGNAVDPYKKIRENFKSDYVVTNRRDIGLQLKSELGFNLLHEPHEIFSQDLWVFSLGERDDKKFVGSFEGGFFAESTAEKYLELTPTQDVPWKKLEMTTSPYLNLFEGIKSSGEKAVNCAQVRPEASDLKHHLGATLLGIGGGRNIRLWLNGKPLYSSISAPPNPRKINTFVPLPKTLSSSDRVEAVVCSQASSPFMGIALSFWKFKEIEDVCRSKIPGYVSKENFTWPYRGAPIPTCLGNIALHVASGDLLH